MDGFTATQAGQEIGALFDRLVEAHARRDAAAIVAPYEPDALVYSLAPPLGVRGMDRTDVEAWLATWEGPIGLEVRDPALVVDRDLAVATALVRMTGTKNDGSRPDVWFRNTTCLRRGAEGWRIFHEHGSVPFHMDGSFRAAIDLQP